MKPQGHVIVSVGLGGLFWARSRDFRTLLISLIFGVLVDIDHLVDYFYAERSFRFNLRAFLSSRSWARSGRVFVLFHGFEYLPFVFLFWQGMRGRKWAIAATSAMSVHLLADHVLNDLKPLGYFITYRLAHRFRASELIDQRKVARVDARRERRRRLAMEGRLPTTERILSIFR